MTTINLMPRTDRNHHTMVTEDNKIDRILHTQEITLKLGNKEITTMKTDQEAEVQDLATTAINQVT